MLQHPEKPKAQQEVGPKKPSTPFALFCKEQHKKSPDSDESELKERCKALWQNMSDKKKVVWINWAAEEEAKYKVKMASPLISGFKAQFSGGT